jgi:hypothetical protein
MRSSAHVACSVLVFLAIAGCDPASTVTPAARDSVFDLLTISDGGLVTTGGAEITLIVDGFTQRWSFSAKRGRDGLASGEFQWTGKLFGSTVTAHGYIACFGISGNRARLGGVVTHSNTPGLVAPEAQVIWSVEDNGEGTNATSRDRATSLELSEAEPHCALSPVPDPTLLPIETGNVQVHN